MRGVFSNANDIYLFLMIFLCMHEPSLNKLVPVQYREYENRIRLELIPVSGRDAVSSLGYPSIVFPKNTTQSNIFSIIPRTHHRVNLPKNVLKLNIQ